MKIASLISQQAFTIQSQQYSGTRKSFEIHSNLPINTPERRNLRSVFSCYQLNCKNGFNEITKSYTELFS